ncbi:uncharacterized protein LOC123318398 [Coccinella septempunctata]|uniref:uncharacterized protein LOC123318398 n=1 Tax=Coccinella septempunctata TaxID=41139 RepID=UPI001D092ADD|nr:uncharacterized protein LOC123318398 [Coccinella septempunctata]
MDFRHFEKIEQKLVHGFKRIFILLLIVVVIIVYGLVQFICRASGDEILKSYVIVALFSLLEFYVPPAQVLMYYWQTENMVKFISQYMDACRGISGHSRKFYRVLTTRRILFKSVVRFIGLTIMTAHIMKGSSCSDKDLRFVCGLYVPLWFPFETNYFPVREIVEIIEILFTYRLLMITVYQSIDSYILAELFEYKCRRLIKLMQKTSLSRVQNVKIVKQKFHYIVDNHQEIYQCFVLIRNILGGIIAPGVTIFIPVTANVSVAFMRDFNIGHLEEFLVTITVSYFCMDSSQRIKDLGEIIQGTAYDMDWYEMDKEMNKEFIIFLMKLRRPFEMKAILFVLEKPFFLSVNLYSLLLSRQFFKY